LGCSTSVVGFDGTSVGEERDFLTQGQTVSETIWIVKSVILGMYTERYNAEYRLSTLMCVELSYEECRQKTFDRCNWPSVRRGEKMVQAVRWLADLGKFGFRRLLISVI
jgi:hypothetical protein